ncbi:MAG: NUDIX hydrolase [SAR324 cluster bacterium]|nr:NUDIX hydrolase [SAR324 cluster bacterium]
MHRKKLLDLLSTYHREYPMENATTDQFIYFVSDHKDCFERSFKKGHITGSAWLVNKKGTHVLLTHHKKLNKWLQLGGHSDGNPDPQAVAFKELCEESGLRDVTPVWEQIFDLDIHLIPQRENEEEHFHYDVRFAFRVLGSEEYEVSGESHDLSWVKISSMGSVTQEISMLRMARKWLNS